MTLFASLRQRAAEAKTPLRMVAMAHEVEQLLDAVEALDALLRLDKGMVSIQALYDGEQVEMVVLGDAYERCLHAVERLGVGR